MSSMSAVGQGFGPDDYFQPVDDDQGLSLFESLERFEQLQSDFHATPEADFFQDNSSDTPMRRAEPFPYLDDDRGDGPAIDSRDMGGIGDSTATGETEKTDKNQETKKGEEKHVPKSIGKRLLLVLAGLASLAAGAALSLVAFKIWPVLAMIGLIVALVTIAACLQGGTNVGGALLAGVGAGAAIASGPISTAVLGLLGAALAFKEAATSENRTMEQIMNEYAPPLPEEKEPGKKA